MSNMQRNMVANTATMSTQSSNRCSRILSGRLQGCQKWTWGLAMRCSHLVRQTHEAVPDAASKAGHGMCRRWEHTERIIRQRQVAGTLSTRMCGIVINCHKLQWVSRGQPPSPAVQSNQGYPAVSGSKKEVAPRREKSSGWRA